MSRFKFTCSCGKRLAAYDWMVSRLVTCPNCGQTLTVPTPFQAQEQLHEMIDRGYTPTRRKLGKPIEKRSGLKVTATVLLAIILAVVAAAVGMFVYFLIF